MDTPEHPPALTEAFLREHNCRHERIQELEQVIFILLLSRTKSLVERFRRLDNQTPPAQNRNPNS